MKKTKHHIISEVYQNSFLNKDEKKVYYLSFDGRIFSSSPEKMLKEEHYNTVNGSLFIEDLFSNIENYFGLVVKKILQKEPINRNDKLILAIYTSIIFNRVKTRREHMRNFCQKIIDKVNLIEDNDFSPIVQTNEDDAKISIDEFVESYKNFNEVFSASSMNVSLDVYEYIYNMNWRFLVAPDNSDFISSDNPVCLCRPDAENKFGPGSYGAVAGLKHLDVELTFPLSSRVALLAGWINSDDLNYFAVTKEFVDNVNYRTIRFAETVFAAKKSDLENIIANSEEK